LKGFDLIEHPAFEVVNAAKRFKKPTTRPNQLWQTDFTYFKITGWGWYYLSSVLDAFSRYTRSVAWKLTPTMGATNVQNTLECALASAQLDKVRIQHRPRLLSDNGPCYMSGELRAYLADQQLERIRCDYLMTQGKIECYHLSLKNVVELDVYRFPNDLENALGRFIRYYNDERYHEAFDTRSAPQPMFTLDGLNAA
jgi:putative transposase